MSIPKIARYNYCVEKAYEFLLYEKVTSFPIDVIKIIQNHKWGKIKYSELALKHNVTISDIKEVFGEDGYTTFNQKNYTIAYNDTSFSKGRLYFTFFHEIGHIILGHFENFNQTILKRGNLTDEEYKVLENEANCFARNVLAPAPIIMQMKLTSGNTIANIFKITKTAAETRLVFLNMDYINLKNKYKQLLVKHYYNFVNKKYCSICKSSFVSSSAKYCPICGHKRLTWREEDMIYNDGFELDENGRAVICPKCGNEELDYKGDYCKICGVYLINKCSDIYEYNQYGESYVVSEGCGTLGAANARFCVRCGKVTTYYQNELLKDWKSVIDDDDCSF